MASVSKEVGLAFTVQENHDGSVSSLPTAEEAIEAINRLMHPVMPPSLDSFPSHDGWGLLVSVEGIDFEYEFTREDLRKVFQRYGKLSGVETLSPNFPYGRVWFRNLSEGKAAMGDLDNKVLNGIHGRLRVVWDAHSLQKLHDYQPPLHPSLSDAVNASVSPSSVRKFTCRFDIGIENDKEFQVARRIIGQKGCNMKKIVETSGAKLRLRGKGSGYLEGPLKQESPEPLHLCVSCTTQKGYNDALKAVSEILEGVYTEYTRYRRSRGRYSSEEAPLRVVVRDTTLPNEKDSFEYPSSPEEPPPITVELPERRLDSGYWKVPS